MLNGESSLGFTKIDYSVFFLMLIVSAVIGFYYAWTERKRKTTEHILLGNRKLKVICYLKSKHLLWLPNHE
jgi:Na+/proline symporter